MTTSTVGELQKFPVEDPVALAATLRPLGVRERIATLRSMFNLSQTELADAVRCRRNAVSNWEAEDDNPRRKTPSRKSRSALAYLFSVPASLFVDD
jgi:DNA-binding XRE family transcriptional regulator